MHFNVHLIQVFYTRKYILFGTLRKKKPNANLQIELPFTSVSCMVTTVYTKTR